MLKESDFRRYNILAWETDALYHAISLGFGLTDSAVNILYLICFEGGKAMLGDIVRHSGLQKQTINSSMRLLEKKGIVTLEKVNGKMKCAVLTREGSQLCDRTVRRLIEWENRAMGSFTKKEVDTFLRLMEKYLRSMELSLEGYMLEKAKKSLREDKGENNEADNI